MDQVIGILILSTTALIIIFMVIDLKTDGRFFAAIDGMSKPLRSIQRHQDDPNFPPIKPKGKDRASIRDHKRVTQKYLMDMWEQRFEEETGADVIRALYVEGKKEVDKIESARIQALAGKAPSYLDESSIDHRVKVAELKFPYSTKSINEQYEEYKKKYEDKLPELHASYNQRMQRSPETPFPKYSYQQFRG